MTIEEERQDRTQGRCNQQEEHNGQKHAGNRSGNGTSPGDSPQEKSDRKRKECQTDISRNVEFPSRRTDGNSHQNYGAGHRQGNNERKLRPTQNSTKQRRELKEHAN